MLVVYDLAGLSKNQKKILGILEIKPDMTTKEIAEMIFGRIVEYKSKEYASVYRSLISIEKQGYIQRVQVQLRWRRSEQKIKSNLVAKF
jgi:DNA-binding MarR family transcriptional regulator